MYVPHYLTLWAIMASLISYANSCKGRHVCEYTRYRAHPAQIHRPARSDMSFRLTSNTAKPIYMRIDWSMPPTLQQFVLKHRSSEKKEKNRRRVEQSVDMSPVSSFASLCGHRVIRCTTRLGCDYRWPATPARFVALDRRRPLSSSGLRRGLKDDLLLRFRETTNTSSCGGGGGAGGTGRPAAGFSTW